MPDRRLVTPVYAYGPDPPKGKTRTTGFMWQCPQSAIPETAWDLLRIWWEARLLREALPANSPLMRSAALVFEMELRNAEQIGQGYQSATAAALAVGAMVKALGN